MNKENLERLDTWYESIKPDKELTIDEARRLNDRIRKLPPNREELMEELVLGTMHVVYSYLRNFGFIDVVNGSYDIDDMIDSFCEVWIENLEIGLYKRSSFSTMFNSKFFDKVNEKLGINEKNSMFPHIKRSDFDNIFFDFFDLKNNGEEIDYDYFMINIEINNMRLINNSTKYELIYEYTQFYKLLNKCYDIYLMYGSHDIPFSKGYVKFLRNFLIEVALDNSDNSYNVGYDYGGYEVAVGNDRKATIKKVVDTLPSREKEVITLRFGLESGDTMLEKNVVKCLDCLLTVLRIGQIEKDAIRKLRHKTRRTQLRDYYD